MESTICYTRRCVEQVSIQYDYTVSMEAECVAHPAEDLIFTDSSFFCFEHNSDRGVC